MIESSPPVELRLDRETAQPDARQLGRWNRAARSERDALTHGPVHPKLQRIPGAWLDATSRRVVFLGDDAAFLSAGATHEIAETMRSIDEQIFNNRFLELRNQLTHSLAPILEWRSLIWFEVGVISDGGVIGYEGKHLTPAERVQGRSRPRRSCSRAPSPTVTRSSRSSSPRWNASQSR